ncbi:MAG: glycosyltransferase [Muribaculaceae bacterium]|nr:glycosyltransferase [Muribaculaceae bacterium]
MISVIVPIYNVADFLKQGLDSLRSQTFSDFEVIMVNDGSTDNSDTIARKYASADSRFKYFEQRNAGLSAARNTGLKHASGNHVAFFDSDDILHPQALEIAITTIKHSGADIARFGIRQFTTDGVCRPHYSHSDILSKTSTFSSREDIRSIVLGLFSPPLAPGSQHIHHSMSACVGIYLRSIIDNNSIRFTPDRRICSEDAIFNFEYLMHVRKYAFVNLPLYLYRKNPESLTRKPRAEYGSEILDTSIFIEKLIGNHYPDNSEHKRAMRYAINALRAHTKNIIGSDMPEDEKAMLVKKLVADRRLQRIYHEYPWQMMPLPDRLHFRAMMSGSYLTLKYLTHLRTTVGKLTGRQS